MRSRPAQPRRWTQEELEADRQQALAAFIEERGREGTQAYAAAFQEIRPVVERLFQASRDLRSFSGSLFEREPDLVAAARFLAGPPVSEDDLATFVGGRLGRRIDPDLAQRIAGVLRAAWDPLRFPWLVSGRRPAQHAREAAINWTAGIWAVERLRTLRRTESSRRQEAAVVRALEEEGFDLRPRPGTISMLDALPRGSFCREVMLGATKCDIAVRLHFGRLLAIECKVSNSGVNSVKRLNRETGDKAGIWRTAFGAQVVTGAVLAGVFKLGNLLQAQNDQGIAIFWEHDLTPLRAFVSRARQ